MLTPTLKEKIAGLPHDFETNNEFLLKILLDLIKLPDFFSIEEQIDHLERLGVIDVGHYCHITDMVIIRSHDGSGHTFAQCAINGKLI